MSVASGTALSVLPLLTILEGLSTLVSRKLLDPVTLHRSLFFLCHWSVQVSVGRGTHHQEATSFRPPFKKMHCTWTKVLSTHPHFSTLPVLWSTTTTGLQIRAAERSSATSATCANLSNLGSLVSLGGQGLAAVRVRLWQWEVSQLLKKLHSLPSHALRA